MISARSASECEDLARAAHAASDPSTAARWWFEAGERWRTEGVDVEAARCFVARADALRLVLKYAATKASAEDALALLDPGRDALLVAEAKRILAIALRHLGRDADSLREVFEAADIFRAHHRQDLAALCANNASHILRDHGEVHRAVTLLESAIADLDPTSCPWLSMLHNSLGLARRAAKDTKGAFAAHEQALRLARHWGEPTRIAASLSNLAAAYRAAGEPHRAKELYSEVLEVTKTPGLQATHMNTYRNLAATERALGEYDPAIEHAQMALAYFRRRRPQRRASAHYSLGRTYAATGAHDDALRHLRAALRYYTERGHPLMAAGARFTIGEVILDQHPDDPRTLRRVLRQWVPVYIELDRARFQFPSPVQRRRWQTATQGYRVALFRVAQDLGETELLADLIESAIHSGAYGSLSRDDGGGSEGEEDPPGTSGDSDGGVDDGTSDTVAFTLGGQVAAVAGSTLPMMPTPPLTAPYGRLRLGRYQRPYDDARLGTW